MSAAPPIIGAQVLAAVDAALAIDGSRPTWDPDPLAHRDHGYPLGRQQCELLYLIARATGARLIVEFATSIGISTTYLAAAVRDNGGGRVVGAEIVPEKVAAARATLDTAGLAAQVEIREGDALETLRDVDGRIDLFVLDGWPTSHTPSLDRRVLDIVVPQFRPGTVVFDDNGAADVVAFLQDPANGFFTIPLPFERGTNHLAVYTP